MLGTDVNVVCVPKQYELLALTVVRHEDSMREFIACDPKNRWTADTPHPFLQALDEAYYFARVTREERDAWKKEVKHDFIQQNFNGLPLEMLNEAAGNPVCVDARCMLGVVSEVAQAVHGVQHSLYSTNTELKSLSHAVKNMEKKVDKIIELLQNNAELAVQHPAAASVPAVPPPMPWTSVKSELETLTCPRRKFVLYHLNRGAASYAAWCKSGNVGNNESKRASSRCASNYKAFSTKMEILARRNVPERPSDDPVKLLHWEDDVQKIAATAFESAKKLLKTDNPSYTAIRGVKLGELKDA